MSRGSRSVCVLLLLLGLLSACRLPIEPVRAPAAAIAPTATSPALAGAQPSPAPASAQPSPAATPTAAPDDRGRNMTLVGALRLDPYRASAHADVAAYNDLAFVGKWGGACAATGVDIIDIADPAAPAHLASTPEHFGLSMEDIAALRIGARDVLAIGLQACGGGPPESQQPGLELVDITDPRRPTILSRFVTTTGVHEFGLTQTPDGQSLALLALPTLETRNADETGRGGTGDLLIVDISDPAAPTQLAEWGVLGEPQLGPEFASAVAQGSYPAAMLHSVRANAAGTRAYLSYWDAGVIMLDISDPARPAYVGRTSYSAREEGNAHSIAVTPDDGLLVEAVEDMSARGVALTSAALDGPRTVLPIPYAESLTSAELAGEAIAVGRGCPAGSRPEDPAEDAYQADPRGKIAIIERGACRVDAKIARAQQAGATGAIIYGGSLTSNTTDLQGESVVSLAGGEQVPLEIPAVFAPASVARELLAAAAPLTIAADEQFDGSGGLRIFDISDPAAPALLSTFATPNARDPDASSRRRWSAHNPDLSGTMLYASWYSDGVRAIDISDPAAPREVGFWTGAGLPPSAPPVDIWGVVAHGDLVLASDFNYGLYILRYDP